MESKRATHRSLLNVTPTLTRNQAMKPTEDNNWNLQNLQTGYIIDFKLKRIHFPGTLTPPFYRNGTCKAKFQRNLLSG